MGFSLNAVMSGFGGAEQATRGTILETLREGAQAARDAFLRQYKVEDTIAAEERHIANIPRTQAAETPGLINRARQEGDIKVDVANRSPRTLAAGASEIINGKIVTTAPSKELPQEQLDYYKALAGRLNAESDMLNRGGKDKQEKPTLPKLKIEKDADGNPYMVDEVSGAIGVIRPGELAKPAVTHWFSKDEPATKAGSPRVDWSLNGKPLPNGLNELYSSMKGQGVSAAAAPASNTGWDNVTGDVFVGGKKVGAVDPKSPTARADAEALAKQPPAAQTAVLGAAAQQPAAVAPAPDIPGGPEVDAARARLASAKSKMQSFGLAAKRKNPSEFAAAAAEVDNAQMALNAAMATYSSNVRPAAARFNVR